MERIAAQDPGVTGPQGPQEATGATGVGHGTAARLSPVEFMRVRRAIRPARVFYLLIAVSCAALGSGYGLASHGREFLPALLPVLLLLVLAAIHLAAFVRVYRQPLFWTRLAAFVATAALVVGYASQMLEGSAPDLSLDGVSRLLLQVGVLAALFDAIPRGDAARCMREEPHIWADYFRKYG